jgi:hypothetical protein
MMMRVPDRSCFSPAALKRWDELGSSTQAKLLGNVWCGACRKAVHISVESARVERGNLILTGRCAECEGNVARLIEGE